MGKVTGFLEIEREDRDYQSVAERVKHWHEFVLPLPEKEIRDQAARCMDCGVPYCHGTSRITGAPTGCPVNNQIPDWNDLVYRGNWDEAARNLLRQSFGAKFDLRDLGILGIPLRTEPDANGRRIGGCLFALVQAPNLDVAKLDHLAVCESHFLNWSPVKLLQPSTFAASSNSGGMEWKNARKMKIANGKPPAVKGRISDR